MFTCLRTPFTQIRILTRDVVRFPLVQLQSMAPQFRDFMQSVPYYGALGGVEFVRPEMVYYGDLA